MAEPLFCLVCGGALQGGGVGFSPYEFACPSCQTAYHVEGEEARYVTPTFVERGETPVVVPLAHLREPGHVRHSDQ
jgi:hypothetical protein